MCAPWAAAAWWYTSGIAAAAPTAPAMRALTEAARPGSVPAAGSTSRCFPRDATARVSAVAAGPATAAATAPSHIVIAKTRSQTLSLPASKRSANTSTRVRTAASTRPSPSTAPIPTAGSAVTTTGQNVRDRVDRSIAMARL